MTEKEPGKNFSLKILSGISLGATGETLALIGNKFQEMVLANRQAYEPLCLKYGKQTVDFLINSGNDMGISLVVLGAFSVFKALTDRLNDNPSVRKMADRLLRIGVIAFTLVPISMEVQELTSSVMQEACKQNGHSCGTPGDLLVFALPVIAVLPGLINNIISSKVKN